MTSRYPFSLVLGALLGSTAFLFPLVGQADPTSGAAATTAPANAADNATPTATPTTVKATVTPSKAGDAATSESKSEDSKPTDKSTAQAKPTPEDMHAQHHADREAFFSAHLAALHAGLALSSDQEGLWSPVESAIRDLREARAERWQMRHDAFAASQAKKGSDEEADNDNDNDSADRLLARGENMIKMGNAIKSLAQATGPLMDSLSIEQKDRLPALTQGLKPKRLLAEAFDLDEVKGGMNDEGMRERGLDFDRGRQGDGRRFDQGYDQTPDYNRHSYGRGGRMGFDQPRSMGGYPDGQYSQGMPEPHLRYNEN